MKRFINFGSIEQFRTIHKNIERQAKFIGVSENGEGLFDTNIKAPIINITCSEKIHGTNASVCYSNEDGFWTQSRKNIITQEQDNAGFSFFATGNEDIFISIIKELAEAYDINLDKYIISLYMEWAGGNIQKKTAITGLDKRCFLFQHFKVSPINQQEAENNKEASKWFETKNKDGEWVSCEDKNIFNIMNFKTYSIDIDFENPNSGLKEIQRIVEEEIEPNSPVGNDFGIEGNIGEGVVCTFLYKDTVYKFKVKGEKHTKTKVKKLKILSEEEEKELTKIKTFANNVATPGRLEQAWQTVFGIENEKQEPDIKFIGAFLKEVMKDVIKEESDLMLEQGIEPKQIGKYVSDISKKWFIEQLNNF